MTGITAVGAKNEALVEESAQVLTSTGAKKKRDIKRSKKQDEKRSKLIEDSVDSEEAGEEILAAETPLKLNFSMMVAMERREAVKAFAEQKFSTFD